MFNHRGIVKEQYIYFIEYYAINKKRRGPLHISIGWPQEKLSGQKKQAQKMCA